MRNPKLPTARCRSPEMTILDQGTVCITPIIDTIAITVKTVDAIQRDISPLVPIGTRARRANVNAVDIIDGLSNASVVRYVKL